MTELETTTPTAGSLPDHGDRGCVLIGCGVLTAGLGLLCGGTVVMVVFVLVLEARGQLPPGSQISMSTMMPSIVVYGLGTILLLTLGVGSILKRRWARTLIMALAWIMLVTGIVTMVAMAMLPMDLFDRLLEASPGPKPPPQAITLIKVTTGIAMLVVYVLLPVAYLLAYGGKNVRATCEASDPNERWTDRAPLPVLVLSILSVLAAAAMFTMPLMGMGTPVFGELMGGLTGNAVSVGLGVVWIVLAVGQFRRSALAWASTIVMTVLGGASAIITFEEISLVEMYRQTGILPEDQILALERSGILDVFNMSAWIGIIVVVYLGYVVLIRHYFLKQESSAEPGD